MSEEIERLRADLEALNRVLGLFYLDGGSKACHERIDQIRDRIAQLEDEADPWREAKSRVEDLEGMEFHWDREVARYVRHLEAENARLTARVDELESQNDKFTSQIGRLQASALAKHVQDVYAERDRLAARVAELENTVPPLEPTRVYATWCKMLGIKQWMDRDAEPYLLAGSEDTK